MCTQSRAPRSIHGCGFGSNADEEVGTSEALLLLLLAGDSGSVGGGDSVARTFGASES